MDKIRLTNIECQSRIGITQQERSQYQQIQVDLVLSLDLEAAGKSDLMELTVDYRRVIDQVQTITAEREYHLVESLALALCRSILKENHIFQIQVTVKKRPADLQDKVGEVTVEMSRPE